MRTTRLLTASRSIGGGGGFPNLPQQKQPPPPPHTHTQNRTEQMQAYENITFSCSFVCGR